MQDFRVVHLPEAPSPSVLSEELLIGCPSIRRRRNFWPYRHAGALAAHDLAWTGDARIGKTTPAAWIGRSSQSQEAHLEQESVCWLWNLQERTHPGVGSERGEGLHPQDHRTCPCGFDLKPHLNSQEIPPLTRAFTGRRYRLSVIQFITIAGICLQWMSGSKCHRSEFPDLGIIGILDWLSLCCQSCSVPCRIFSSISGL